MTTTKASESQIQSVSSFEELVAFPFAGETNALCWDRTLKGDFAEIIQKVSIDGNITQIGQDELCNLELSDQGTLAREIILNDLKVLSAYGASPVLNVIKCYDRDDASSIMATDVYSFHVDRSPVPFDTFLCTYYGASSEIIPNSQADQKILIPEIRQRLVALFEEDKEEYENFEDFLAENFFDLHYQAKPNAEPISLGLGKMWRLAIDHPESKVLPCVHRAPIEVDGELRLMVIC